MSVDIGRKLMHSGTSMGRCRIAACRAKGGSSMGESAQGAARLESHEDTDSDKLRPRRVGRLLAWIANRLVPMDGGKALSETNHGKMRNGNPTRNGTLAPEPPDSFRTAFISGIRRALVEERDNPDTGYRPDDIYPPGLDTGSPVYRDPAIWGADWRDTLPPDDPCYITDPKDRITPQDRAYKGTLKFMDELETYR